jgi:succinate dehydrogenase/fumarate reductase-like Fe-S protein
MARFGALGYLGFRATMAHPIKIIARRDTGAERFLDNYGGEGLTPTRPEDRQAAEAASACIGCGLCELACDLASAAPAIRALGIEAVFRLYAKSSAELPWAREALAACSGCRGCEPLCPTGVPIGSLVRHFLAKVGRGG